METKRIVLEFYDGKLHKTWDSESGDSDERRFVLNSYSLTKRGKVGQTIKALPVAAMTEVVDSSTPLHLQTYVVIDRTEFEGTIYVRLRKPPDQPGDAKRSS